MNRWEDFKRVKDAAKSKIEDTDFSKLAGDAVLGASTLAEGAESVAKRSGLTKKNGEISKLRVAKAATRPRQTARTLLDAAAQELRERRESGEEDAPKA